MPGYTMDIDYDHEHSLNSKKTKHIPFVNHKIEKFSENRIISDVIQYISSTYDGHYSQNKFQAMEFIIDSGHGLGFSLGAIMKYAQRYGNKGEPADHRKDLMKIIHFAIMALHCHDLKQSQECDQIMQKYCNGEVGDE